MRACVRAIVQERSANAARPHRRVDDKAHVARREASAMDTERPDTNTPVREKDDENVSPLGRGANPGSHDPAGAIDGPSIAGQRGMGTQGQRGGHSGLVDRENEDSMQARRDPSTGYDSAENETAQ